MSTAPAPLVPKLQTQPSFQTLNQLHFLATGEPLPHVPGDACPHPPEWYIKKTQEKQQRQRAYDMLYEVAAATATDTASLNPIPVKASSVNGIPYDHIMAGPMGQILLYSNGLPIMTLWPDGQEHKEITPAASPHPSPAPRFCLRSPPIRAKGVAAAAAPEDFSLDATSPTAYVPSPTATAYASKVPHYYARILQSLSTEELHEALEGWTAKKEEATAYCAALTKEIEGRAARIKLNAPRTLRDKAPPK